MAENGLCAMTGPTALAAARNRAAVMAELRRLMPRMGEQRKPLPFGLGTIDSHLPDGGLACGALHEVVPAAEGCVAAAFGFIAAVLARLASPLLFVMPTYGLRPYRPHGRLHGHGLNALGLDPARLILVETAHRKETLWAMEEAVRSAAPAAVVGVIDTLDLKLSQRLHSPLPTRAFLFFYCGRRRRWNRARRQRAGASAPRQPHATVSASSRSRAGICNSSVAATDGRANG